MSTSPYLPIFELTRGKTIESIHNGAVAVVDAHGNLVAWHGDPEAVTFMRSSAKPFQAMPFIQHGGQAFFQLTDREVALICASHAGTDAHVAVLQDIQLKAGVTEADLMCGVHYPFDEATTEALRERKEKPTPNRHNCSGKHTGMMAYVRMRAKQMANDDDLAYIDMQHPIQKEILHNFADMCAVPVEQVSLGVDGCSAPNFAVPLRNAAFGFARLCDPETGRVGPVERATACRTIVAAITANPDMIAGPGEFDTVLMQVSQGRILAKGGAEGYQGVGLPPGALGPGSPALGICLKIGDGGARYAARPAVVLEVLRQLGALSSDELEQLSAFGPRFPIYNWRKILVGEGRPRFELQRARLS